MYSSRVSASSNNFQESFQLYERRFGNTREANQIYDLLKLKIALLPGGKDQKQGPIIIFPQDFKSYETTESDILTCLIYLGSIPSEESAKRGFSVIVDNQRKTYTKTLTLILHCCQKAFENAVSDIYIVEDSLNATIDYNPNITSANIHIVTKPQLRVYFDLHHLLPAIGGTLNYNHEAWMRSRLFVESYVKETRTLCSELDVFIAHVSNNLFRSVQADLRKLWFDYLSVKAKSEEFVRRGNSYCVDNQPKSQESFEEDQSIVVQRIIVSIQNVERRLGQLDGLWQKKDMEEHQKSAIAALEMEMREVVDWILGPGDKLLLSQVEVGKNYNDADELRKRHEQFELKCLDSYGKYAELRHKVEAYVNSSATEDVKASELMALRDYMDTVCRSFANRVEQRRNTVIASARFHRLIEEILQLLDGLKRCLNDPIDFAFVENTLDNLNDFSDKLDFNCSMAKKEGGQLQNKLFLPMKDAYGQEININREPDISLIENCLQEINNERDAIRENLDLKKLHLQQLLQLQICEQNIEQAINWIKELDELLNKEQTQTGGQTLQDLERFQDELRKGETTAKNSFEYGQQLLEAAMQLRRSLQLDIRPNNDQADRLHDAWKLFSKSSNENATRKTAVAIFDKKSDEFLKETENLLHTLEEAPPGTKLKEQFLKEFSDKKKTLDAHHKELKQTGDGLHERIQKPILYYQGNEKQMKFNDVQMVDNVKTKLQTMDERMNQLTVKWRNTMQNGYSGSNSAFEGPDVIPFEKQDHEVSSRKNMTPAPLEEWLESNPLRRIKHTNDMGKTLKSTEEFYEKHVESLQAMKSQEAYYNRQSLSGSLRRNLPEQWDIVQEIIKQRISLSLSLIKFHLSINKASEDLNEIENVIRKTNDKEKINSVMKNLERNEEMIEKNAAEFLEMASNQIYRDEYLNVEEPKYFVREIIDQWKMRKAAAEMSLNKKPLEEQYEHQRQSFIAEAKSVNKELDNLELELARTSALDRDNNTLNRNFEVLQEKVNALQHNLDSELNPTITTLGRHFELKDYNDMVDELNSKLLNAKRSLRQADQFKFLNKNFSSSGARGQNSSDLLVTVPLQDAIVKIGESLRLTCHVTASPVQKVEVKWMKDGVVIDVDMNKYTSEYRGGQCDLIIHKVSDEDSGNYSCIATDGYQPAISSARVSVEAAPAIVESLKDQSVTEGQPVEFSLKVTGNPIPTVKWFVNGKELSSTPDFKIYFADGRHVLRISEVFDEDKGLYTVVARNKHGEATDRARLRVQVGSVNSSDGRESSKSKPDVWSPPTGASSFSFKASSAVLNPKSTGTVHSGFVKALTDKSLQAGEDVILECNLPLFPVPNKILWYKDGIEITRTMPGIRTSCKHGLCCLVIERADISHSGKYVCRVEVNDRLFETSMNLSIKDKVSMLLNKDDSRYSSSSLATSKRAHSSSSDVSPSFQVSSFESTLRSQSVPRNSLGSSSDFSSGYFSQISNVPQFVKKLENGMLVENFDATFYCKVTGEPAPNIQWYHNGRLIRPSSKYNMKLNKSGDCSLTIVKSSKQDAGYYTCCALNVTGRDVCSAELIMEGATDIDTTSYVQPETLKRIMMPKTSRVDDTHSGVVEVCAEPRFSKSSSNAVAVEQGETARLDCKVIGHPSPDLSWFKNGKEILKGGRHQVVLNQEGTQSLVIKSVQPSDAGVYTCRAHNKAGQATMDFTLQVDEPPLRQRPRISSPLSGPGLRVMSERATSSPSQPESPTYVSTAKAFSDSSKMKMSSKQAELQKTADQDLSIPVSSTRSSSSPKPVEHFPPRFLVVPDSVTVEEGGRAKFWAKVSGSPSANVTWSINGLDIFSSSRFNVIFDGLMHVLEIMKARKFDNGEVKVTARNYKGAVQHSVQLVVSDPVDLRSHLHHSQPSSSSKQSASATEEITEYDSRAGSGANFKRTDLLKEVTDTSLEGWKTLKKNDERYVEPKISFVDGRTTAAFGDRTHSKAYTDSRSHPAAATEFKHDERKVVYVPLVESDSFRTKNVRNESESILFESTNKFPTKTLEDQTDYGKSKGAVFKPDIGKPELMKTESSRVERSKTDWEKDVPTGSGILSYSTEFITEMKTAEESAIERSTKFSEDQYDFGKSQTLIPSLKDISQKPYVEHEHSQFSLTDSSQAIHKTKVDKEFKAEEDSVHGLTQIFPIKTTNEAKSYGRTEIIVQKPPLDEAEVSEEKTPSDRIPYEHGSADSDNYGYSVTEKLDEVEDFHSEDVLEDKHRKGKLKHIMDEEIALITDKQIAESPEEEIKPSQSGESPEERSREQKFTSTVTEEITFKDVNNKPQKFSTRLLKTVEYTKTNSYKSSTKDEPENTGSVPEPKPPFKKHAMAEFEWNIDESSNAEQEPYDMNHLGDHYRKWREETSEEISEGSQKIQQPGSATTFCEDIHNDDLFLSGEGRTADAGTSSNRIGDLIFYSDKATGEHLEISNKGVQYDAFGRVVPQKVVLSTPIEKSTTVQDIETTDEITVETKVTQVKTVSLQLSESGDINLTETTQVQTDTDMKETKKTKEREELIVSHVISDVEEHVDGDGINRDYDSFEPNVSDEDITYLPPEKFDLFSTWDIVLGVYIAVGSYEPDSDEVMSLHDGEKVELLGDDTEDWWMVRKSFDNREGFVPSQFLISKSDHDRAISDEISKQINIIGLGQATVETNDSYPESAPQMEKLLSNISASDGDHVIFECKVSGNPRPSITWFHNSKVIKPSPEFLQFYDPEYMCSLSIREVFPEDGGRYTMVAKSILGIASSSAELTVVENEFIQDKDENKVIDEASPLLVNQPKHLVLDEGQQATFACKFKGKTPLKVNWFHNGRPLSTSNLIKYEMIEEDVDLTIVQLSMENVHETHTGKYKVSVSNDHGNAEANTSLVVKATPKVVDFKAGLKKTIRSTENQDVKYKEEKVFEERNYEKKLHSHTEEDSSFGSSEVIQHDFRSVLKAAPTSSSHL